MRVAITVAVIACLAGALMFRFVRRRNRNRRDRNTAQPLKTPFGPTFAAITNDPIANSAGRVSFNAVRFAQLNPWLSEGQPDDRTPMIGSITDNTGTPSARRAFARRSHQASYKEWSKARHD